MSSALLCDRSLAQKATHHIQAGEQRGGERVKQTVVAAGMVAWSLTGTGVSVLEVSGISLVLCNNKCAQEGRAMTRVIPHVETSNGRPLDLLPPCR